MQKYQITKNWEKKNKQTNMKLVKYARGSYDQKLRGVKKKKAKDNVRWSEIRLSDMDSRVPVIIINVNRWQHYEFHWWGKWDIFGGLAISIYASNLMHILFSFY